MQAAKLERSHGACANRAGHHGRGDRPVRALPLTHHAWTRAPSPGCGLSRAGGMGVCRDLEDNGFMGPLPSELGNLDVLNSLCVHRHRPPRLDACAVTGL